MATNFGGYFFTALFINALSPTTDDRIVYIRNKGHSVVDAVNRQLAHYPYHVGQIIFIGKMLKVEEWKSLSIPKGSSQSFNKEKFEKLKHIEHFTDEILNKKKES